MHPFGGFNSIHPNAINPTSYSVGFLVSTLQLRGWRRYYAGNFFVITDWEGRGGGSPRSVAKASSGCCSARR